MVWGLQAAPEASSATAFGGKPAGAWEPWAQGTLHTHPDCFPRPSPSAHEKEWRLVQEMENTTEALREEQGPERPSDDRSFAVSTQQCLSAPEGASE